MATLNSAISIYCYTNMLCSMKNLHVKYDSMVSTWPAARGNSAGKTEVWFTWQPVSRIRRKLKTKDMLQVIKSFILSKTSSTISLWRHSQTAATSKYSSLPEGFVATCINAVWFLHCGDRKCGFPRSLTFTEQTDDAQEFPPREELNVWLSSVLP